MFLAQSALETIFYQSHALVQGRQHRSHIKLWLLNDSSTKNSKRGHCNYKQHVFTSCFISQAFFKLSLVFYPDAQCQNVPLRQPILSAYLLSLAIKVTQGCWHLSKGVIPFKPYEVPALHHEETVQWTQHTRHQETHRLTINTNFHSDTFQTQQSSLVPRSDTSALREDVPPASFWWPSFTK